MFKYIELFAGIGGFRSALDTLGGECVFASEIDKYATKSYKALYNGAPELHGDITQVEAEDIPDHDVLVGGFPCQAFSVAGQRKGFEDARGTLFFEIARIAKVKQPRLMLLENVKGLLSHDSGRTFETMCAILNDIGYAIDFRVLNSKHFGVPQNRERIFIVCDRDAEHAEWDVTGNDVVAKAKRMAQALGVRTFNFDWPENSEVTTRLRDVLETHVDEKYYLSEEKTAKLIAQLEERSQSMVAPAPLNLVSRGPESRADGVAYCLKGAEGGSSKQHLLESGPIIAGSLEHYGNDQMNRVYSVDGLAPTITVVSGGIHEQKITEPQLEQYSNGSGLAYTVDANYAKGTSPGDIGKGRRTHVVISDDGLGRKARVREDETSAPLRAVAGDRPGTWVAQSPRYRIRKLTPRECWRLQGFTDAQHDAVTAAGISDSQRYKQAGNAVTVNVIRALGERLIPRLAELSETGNRLTPEKEAA